jgi:hypothetical protein
MEPAQEEVLANEGAHQPDVVALIFRHLIEPQDVLAAAAVCRFTSLIRPGNPAPLPWPFFKTRART